MPGNLVEHGDRLNPFSEHALINQAVRTLNRANREEQLKQALKRPKTGLTVSKVARRLVDSQNTTFNRKELGVISKTEAGVSDLAPTSKHSECKVL